MSAAKIAVVPDAAPSADDGWEAVIAPPIGLMGVKDIVPDPDWGHIEGNRDTGYVGGLICPDCVTLVRFRGKFVPRGESITGEFIEITCRAAGRGTVGEISGKQALYAHWTCPRCPKGVAYKQMALRVVSREPAFRAEFVRRPSGDGA